MSTVMIPLGASIQAAIDANPAGTVFQLADGTYYGQQFNPLSNDQFIGAADGGTVLSGAAVLNQWTQSGSYWVDSGLPAPLTGAVISGSNPLSSDLNDLFINNVVYTRVASLAQVTAGSWYFDPTTNSAYISDNPTGQSVQYSVTPNLTASSATGVVFQNLTIERYATDAQNGPIQGGGDWSLIDVTSTQNHGAGLVIGAGTVVQGGSYSDNGQVGIDGYESNGAQILDATIADNNYAGYNTGWDAGGIKLATSANVTISGNQVYGNNGQGIWADIDSTNWTVSNNTVANNAGNGIMYEISHGTTGITNNVVTDNAGAGIYISNSDGVTATGNAVTVGPNNTNGSGGAAGGGGIDIINTVRGSGPDGLYQAINDTVQHNTIIHTTDTAEDGIYVYQPFTGASNDVFNSNTYDVSNMGGAYWHFGTTDYNWTALHQDTTYESSGVENNGMPASPNDTVVVIGSTAGITDANGNVWTITRGGQVAVNGVADTSTFAVVRLAYVNGEVWQNNSVGQWYGKTQANTVWGGETNVSPLPFTASANKTVVNAGSTAGITDANGNLWTITSGAQVAVNGMTDAATAKVAELAYVNGTIWQENTASQWSGETLPNDSWSAPTLSAPLPAVGPTTGSGSDMLVLQVSEDYYLGQNAQFTVSMDGIQQGGTFTATALNDEGNEETFTFKGNWAPGSHTVGVDFLNDAYGGSRSLDRNLFVKSTTYDGKNFGDGLNLFINGTQTVVVQDTTPIVITIPATEASVPISFISGTINATSGNHQFLISGHTDTFNLSGGIETITDSGTGGNTFKLPVAGNGSAIFSAAALSDGDVFGLKAALAATHWTGSASTLSSFLKTAQSGSNTNLLVSTTAGGAGTLLATFGVANVSLSTILAHSTTT